MGKVQVSVLQVVRDGSQPSLPVALSKQVTIDDVLLVSDEQDTPSNWVAVNGEDEIVAPANPGNYAFVISISGTARMRVRFGIGVVSSTGGWILQPGMHEYICNEEGVGVCITEL